MKEHQKLRRGFRAMDAEKQREIATHGGQSVKSENRAFSRDPALAAAAGRKGGLASGRARSERRLYESRAEFERQIEREKKNRKEVP